MGVYKLGKGVTIPLQYERVTYIGSDRLCVRKQNMYSGAFTGDGKQVLPFVFADITACQDGFFTAALFRDQQSFAAVQKQGLYANGYVALFQHSGNYIFDGWGYDVSTIPSYAMWGVIDENQNACTDFSYERIRFDGTTVRLGTWNGDHEYANPYSSIANAATGVLAKKYDYEIKPISTLSKTGETLTSLIQKSGVVVPDMPFSPSIPAPATIGGFTDVKTSDYYADAVLWAVEQNITSGTSKTTFSPNNTCSNAEILTFLWRANGSPEPTAANPFTDVKTTDYFYKAALWAAEKGLVSGSTFGANTDCTRAMTMDYMWKAAGSPVPAGKADFTDVPASADYAQAVAWAVENKITSGTGGGNFSPAATCTRGQIVTFLHRAMGK